MEIQKLKQALDIIECLNEEKKECLQIKGRYIVILQRGWVYVGDIEKKGSWFFLSNAFCIRQWGTTKGLGELAVDGKKENTKLDEVPNGVSFHELTMIHCIPVISKNL